MPKYTDMISQERKDLRDNILELKMHLEVLDTLTYLHERHPGDDQLYLTPRIEEMLGIIKGSCKDFLDMFQK